MRVLFVQHDHVSPVGPVGERFVDRGFDVAEFVVVPEHAFHEPAIEVEFPDFTAYDALVPMGAPWSVYDEPTIGAWILEELALLRRAHEAGIPILGICFGAQALAAALGGSVERAPEAEIGWYEIESDDPALVPAGPWFQWHHDRLRPPPGARDIARTSLAVQAYVLPQTLAVQFHPELTLATLEGWLANGGAEYLTAHGRDPDRLLDETRALQGEAALRARGLVDAFLDTVVAGQRSGAIA